MDSRKGGGRKRMNEKQKRELNKLEKEWRIVQENYWETMKQKQVPVISVEQHEAIVNKERKKYTKIIEEIANDIIKPVVSVKWLSDYCEENKYSALGVDVILVRDLSKAVEEKE